METLNKMFRRCSEIGAQNMAGYLIRNQDLQEGDIEALKKVGYQVYGLSYLEGYPFRIEKRINCPGRYGIAVFTNVILFPSRKTMSSTSAMNYYTINNQYSWFEPRVMRRDFMAKCNRPVNYVIPR